MSNISAARTVAHRRLTLPTPRWRQTIAEYYQLAKPGIVFSNVLTGGAGYLFASRWQLQIGTMFALLVGTSLIIASACVFNNYFDRSLDQRMQRTRGRALVTGVISGSQALAYASCLGLIGFTVLSWTNLLTMAIGSVAFVGYVVIYGVAKRRTVHGTLVGTLPGAASLVAGYTAATSRLDVTALILGVIMVAWQMPHFYAIALRRFDDYQAAGLPVWPVKKGTLSTKRWILFYVALFVMANVLLVVYGRANHFYLLVTTGFGLYWWYRGWQGFRQSDTRLWARGMFGLSLLVLMAVILSLPLAALRG